MIADLCLMRSTRNKYGLWWEDKTYQATRTYFPRFFRTLVLELGAQYVICEAGTAAKNQVNWIYRNLESSSQY